MNGTNDKTGKKETADLSGRQILVTRSSMPPLEEYMEEIRSMWETHRLTNMGPRHEALSGKLLEYLGVNHIELFVNGHMALELTLQAMNLQGEVITTPFTFASTTHAIVRNRLTPVFCDIDPVTYTMDPARIEELITDQTCAIMRFTYTETSATWTPSAVWRINMS